MTRLCAGDRAARDRGVDRAVRVTLPEDMAEVAGAVLMDRWGPFAQEAVPSVADPGPGGLAETETCACASTEGFPAGENGLVTLVFYPSNSAAADVDAILESSLPALCASGRLRWETCEISREWVDGWKEHFHPVIVGRVRICPPWERTVKEMSFADEATAVRIPDGAETLDGIDTAGGAAEIEVVINPGLGFGTGMHPTTRGVLQLFQAPGPVGPVVDVGTGSGILAIAAAKLGWGPVIAFDSDPVALISARANVEANKVGEIVDIHEVDVAGAASEWFAGATVLANMTLEPVVALIRRFGEGGSLAGGGCPNPAATDAHLPLRVVVSGILAGAQEFELLNVAQKYGFVPGQRLYEDEWVTLEFVTPRPRGRRSRGRSAARRSVPAGRGGVESSLGVTGG